ncbi:hypothetical protein AB0F88_14480 [Streptosporangium sp. NPDC023963]|uniref:hypothetical protein n=1 Tax=Streptosporangium sp. NPDC023963 TaxID=3155608 RepID=UPI003429CFEB
MTTSTTPVAPVPVREGTFARVSTGVPGAVSVAVSVVVSMVVSVAVYVVGLAGAPVVTSAGEAA